MTDELVADEDAEGYSSRKLGMKIYCPLELVEDVIFLDLYCYEEEDEYLQNKGIV